MKFDKDAMEACAEQYGSLNIYGALQDLVKDLIKKGAEAMKANKEVEAFTSEELVGALIGAGVPYRWEDQKIVTDKCGIVKMGKDNYYVGVENKS